MAEDLEIRHVAVEEIEKGELPKDSFILVRWMDASDTRARMVDHEEIPDGNCKDWALISQVIVHPLVHRQRLPPHLPRTHDDRFLGLCLAC
ncbi:MAG: hypothetical protein NWE89_04805 [Candidatus Bathyarchaeota archaeon]|nr:hypothetical protein [Candidatus Bathyarchaeota archaeon]